MAVIFVVFLTKTKHFPISGNGNRTVFCGSFEMKEDHLLILYCCIMSKCIKSVMWTKLDRKINWIEILLINIFSMTDCNYVHNQFLIKNLVNNSITSNSYLKPSRFRSFLYPKGRGFQPDHRLLFLMQNIEVHLSEPKF